MAVSLEQVINRFYFKGLVYNQSCEDPVLDQEALQIQADHDVVLSITSGGCNSLNLLCLRPKEIICIDSNLTQTYFLELKLAGISALDYADFFAMFGAQAPARSKYLYRQILRNELSVDARRFWDHNISLFERGIYSQGKLGFTMRLLRFYLRRVLGDSIIEGFFETENLVEQRHYYLTKIVPKIGPLPFKRFLSPRLVSIVTGIPPHEYNLIEEHIGIEKFARTN